VSPGKVAKLLFTCKNMLFIFQSLLVILEIADSRSGTVCTHPTLDQDKRVWGGGRIGWERLGCFTENVRDLVGEKDILKENF
jgi:hypothetical protein